MCARCAIASHRRCGTHSRRNGPSVSTRIAASNRRDGLHARLPPWEASATCVGFLGEVPMRAQRAGACCTHADALYRLLLMRLAAPPRPPGLLALVRDPGAAHQLQIRARAPPAQLCAGRLACVDDLPLPRLPSGASGRAVERHGAGGEQQRVQVVGRCAHHLTSFVLQLQLIGRETDRAGWQQGSVRDRAGQRGKWRTRACGYSMACHICTAPTGGFS